MPPSCLSRVYPSITTTLASSASRRNLRVSASVKPPGCPLNQLGFTTTISDSTMSSGRRRLRSAGLLTLERVMPPTRNWFPLEQRRLISPLTYLFDFYKFH